MKMDVSARAVVLTFFFSHFLLVIVGTYMYLHNTPVFFMQCLFYLYTLLSATNFGFQFVGFLMLAGSQSVSSQINRSNFAKNIQYHDTHYKIKLQSVARTEKNKASRPQLLSTQSKTHARFIFYVDFLPDFTSSLAIQIWRKFCTGKIRMCITVFLSTVMPSAVVLTGGAEPEQEQMHKTKYIETKVFLEAWAGRMSFWKV